MGDIFIYLEFKSWLKETPDATIKGQVVAKNDNFVEIRDESGFTQVLNIAKLFALVY